MKYNFPQKAKAVGDLIDWEHHPKTVIPNGAVVFILFADDKAEYPNLRMCDVLYKGDNYRIPRSLVQKCTMTAVTLEECANQDWKTQSARGYGNVPKGVEVKVIESTVTNLYKMRTREPNASAFG